MLVGRRAELDVLADVIARGRSGGSATLVVSGEPGVGKTALLDALVDLAHDFRVIRIEGIESELQLDYAVLHRIVRPFMDEVDRLPAPQRDAIKAAFGLSPSERADKFLVGLAALTLLGGPEQPGDRLPAVRQPTHSGVPPEEDLPEVGSRPSTRPRRRPTATHPKPQLRESLIPWRGNRSPAEQRASRWTFPDAYRTDRRPPTTTGRRPSGAPVPGCSSRRCLSDTMLVGARPVQNNATASRGRSGSGVSPDK
jgi:AAA ATPase-like protein